MQCFFDKGNDAIELADAVAGDVAGSDDFHAVKLPHVKIVNVHNAFDALDLSKQRISVNVLWDKLHDDFGNADQLRNGGIRDDHDYEQGAKGVDEETVGRAAVFDDEA
jgi:hypothetical protein